MTKNFLMFMESAMPMKIPDFKLRFNQFIEPIEYMDVLKEALPRVENEIYLNQFELNSQSLKMLMEASCNCQNLAIYDCKVDLSEGFTLDTSKRYNFTVLNLSMTISDNENSKDRMTLESLPKFVVALAETNLKQDLKTLYLWESYCSKTADVEKLFNDNGFDLQWQEEP